jgi:hypothetical protein
MGGWPGPSGTEARRNGRVWRSAYRDETVPKLGEHAEGRSLLSRWMVTAHRRDSLLGAVKPTAIFYGQDSFTLWGWVLQQRLRHTASCNAVSSASVRRCVSPGWGMCVSHMPTCRQVSLSRPVRPSRSDSCGRPSGERLRHTRTDHAGSNQSPIGITVAGKATDLAGRVFGSLTVNSTGQAAIQEVDGMPQRCVI